MSIRQNQQAASDDFDAFIAALRRTDPDAVPSTSYRSSLREQLMENTSTWQASQSAIGPGRAKWQRSLTMPGVGRRALAFGATAALLVAVVVTALLINGNGAPTSNKEAGGFLFPTVDATPMADPTRSVASGRCQTESGFIAACNNTWVVSSASFEMSDLPESANQVQMQDWQIEPDGSVTYKTDVGGTQGVAIDLMTVGAAVSYFNMPVTVFESDLSGSASNITTVEANQPVRLVQGNSVSYPIGSKISTANMLESRYARFKTVLIADRQMSIDEFVDDGEYIAYVDGAGIMPEPTDIAGQTWYSVQLTFTRDSVPEDFPNAYEIAHGYVLGPVGPGPEEGLSGFGFILWIDSAGG